MSRVRTTSILLLATLAAACSSASGGTTGDDQNVSGGKATTPDSAGCGDGTKSVPNSWFMSVAKSDGPLFEAVTLMSSNLFEIKSVSAIADTDGTAFPVDVASTKSLIFELTFTPGRDSVGLPTAHADSIKNRDKVLLRLQALGAAVDCNNILHTKPLDGASPSGGSVRADVDSLGCGDGTKSAPNGWFVSFDKSDAPLFNTIALLSSNLFDVHGVTADIPAGGTAFPEDTSKAKGLIFEEGFTPARNSLVFPTIAKDSVTNRDKVLRDLKSGGVTISCDQIGVAHPGG